MDIINSAKNKLFIASFSLGIASSIFVFAPNTNDYIKNISRVFLGLSIGGIVTGEYLTSVCIQQTRTNKKEWEYSIKDKDSCISTQEREIEKIKNELRTVKAKGIQVENALNEALQIISTRNSELDNCRNTINKLNSDLKVIGRFNTSEAYQIVRTTYTTAFKKLDGHIEALKRNYPDIANKYEQLHIEIDNFRRRYINKLEEYEQIESFNELLDVGMDIQEKVINGCIELRVKAQTILIRYLDSLLENAVSLDEYESTIKALESHVGVTVENLKLEHQANVRAIAQEWVIANNSHVERYQTSFDDVLQTAKYASEKLQERDIQINDLLTRLQELELPFLLPGEPEQAKVSNSIAMHYLSIGYRLDCIDWLQTDTGYKLLFSTSRNGQRFISGDMLNDKELALPEKLKELSNALNTPKFERSERGGHWYVDIQKWYPRKEKIQEKDISKLWVTVDKFEPKVKHWERIRITGGSKSGKSPTAENIAIIMALHSSNKKISLYNPREDSLKNHWSIPAIGNTHDDSRDGLKALVECVENKVKGLPIYLFDEIDNTLTDTKQGKKQYAVGNQIKFILKEASHDGLKVIFVGQNANSSNYPGFERTDWNNAINMHIGDNAYDAITNSNLFTNTEQVALKEKADKIKAFCESKNEELGLDENSENAYRFAFIVEPGKRPYFMELPSFGSYTYDLLDSITTDSSNSAEHLLDSREQGRKLDSTVAKTLPEYPYSGAVCPKCNKGTLKPTTQIRGVNYYKCSQCNKKSSENVLRDK